ISGHRNSHVLGVLFCAFCLPLVVPFENIAIPEELKSAVGRVATNSTPCSVTCGLGFKLEEMCEVTPAGERRNCTLERSHCVANWICGLVHFTVPTGRAFQFSCLTPHPAGLGSQAYSYMWKVAQGLISTSDELFLPFRNRGPVVRFSPTRESDAGTYRCDVRLVRTFRIVKRVYFGVRVIHSDLVDLNFEKSLTSEQKLAASKEEGNTEKIIHEEVREEQQFWQRELLYQCLIGIGSGVAGGVLVSVAVCFLQKVLRR
ncbi:TMM81 protein, partial [Pterocles burchelli]|nr:TMM81 protein [Pterocles burchelli]